MITEKEKFCIDSYLVNKNADLAYTLSREKASTTDNKEIIHRMALRWLRGKEVQDYINDRQVLFQSNAEVKNENRNKNDIVKDLNVLASSCKDPKLKTEILMKLADLQQMKQEEIKDDESTIHYYLPLKCNNCELYAKKLKECKDEPKND